MKSLLISLVLLGLAGASHAETLSARRPVATYSIVARDSLTGQMGVAVQSHWFSVGPIVPWAEAGVGAVATQSLVDPAYGPLGLDLMRMGRSASETLTALVSTDEGASVRQVAMVDRAGRAAAHTGKNAIRAAGHHVGNGYSVQANLMDKDTVWAAMARAYEGAAGDLAERLLASLEAAEGEGGDIRGRQSAAILIVNATGTGKPWKDRLFDLRVEDHPDPVQELRRLVTLQRAYHKLNEGDEHLETNQIDAALDAYRAATELVPDEATQGEAAFWVGVTLADLGRVQDALPYLKRAYRQNPRWSDLIPRLPLSNLLKADAARVKKLVAEMKMK